MILRSPVRSFAVSVLVSVLLAATPALASGWRGIEPGVTSRAAVIKQFGEPMKVLKHEKETLIGYFAAHAIKGTRQVIFRVDNATDVVHRIDVFPATRITKQLVENSYGPPCSTTAQPEGPCYLQKLQDTQTYLHYVSQGLAVFLKSDGRTVFSFVYVGEPKPQESTASAEAGATQAAPEDTSSHPEDAIESVDAQPTPDASASAGLSGGGGSLDVSSLNDDPLKIGGLVYLRGDVLVSKAQKLKADNVTVPSLIDAYFDGRPTDRLRAMVVGRLTYDPAQSNSPLLSSTGASTSSPANPSVQLDQLWLSFDVKHVAYVTVGRQHVKWGTAKFWSPTDFLTPVRTDPLAAFDARLGTDMLRINVPWEAASANFTAAGLLDTRGPSSSPLELGAAFRAETILLGAELGVDALFRENHLPAYGATLSSALGPLDVTAEVALRKELDYALWRPVAGGASVPYGEQFVRTRNTSLQPQVSAGAYYTKTLSEKHSLTVGGEGYYNAFGYTDAKILPWLVANDAYEGFHAGKLYAAAYVTYDTSGMVDSSSVTLTGLGNLSDHSYLIRADYFTQVMTALNVELFAQVPAGHAGGEFRYGGAMDAFQLPDGTQVSAQQLAIPQFEVGVGFRLKI